MRVTARNQLKGNVVSVEKGEVNAEVTLEVAPGCQITAVLTKSACEEFGLEVGATAYALVKASHVMIGVD